jgi:hypothetical protein
MPWHRTPSIQHRSWSRKFVPNIKPNSNHWPRNLDDMRADPSRLVTLGDLARLGLVRSYDGAKKLLPPALRLPTTPKCWEARTVLDALGLERPAHADSGIEEREAA